MFLDINSLNVYLVIIYLVICTHNFHGQINEKTERIIVYILAFLLIFFPIEDLHYIAFNVLFGISGLALFRQKKKKEA